MEKLDMLMKKKLASAVTIALAGASISIASAGTTAYNSFNVGAIPNELIGGNSSVPTPAGGAGTDGWMKTQTHTNNLGTSYAAGDVYGDGPATGNFAFIGADVPWIGTDARVDANFNYAGRQTLNWTAALSGAGDSVEISRNDSFSRYGVYADIDTAKGAWHDNIDTGWKHDADIGIFVSDVAQQVNLDISSLGPENINANYGITVYTGQDTSPTNVGLYGHHGTWHGVTPLVAQSVGGSNPGEVSGTAISGTNPFTGGTGLDTLVLDDVLNNNATFFAEAGQVYTIIVGGFQGGGWTVTRDYYQLDITTSPVPVPAAAWLFGSAMLGMAGIGRRKKQA